MTPTLTSMFNTEDVLSIRKLRGGDYWVNTTVGLEGDRLILQFPYSPDLLAEVKVMAGRRWHPDEKYWSIKDCERNRFHLASLSKELPDPYEWYDQELVELEFERPLMTQQKEMTCVGVTLRRVLLAAEQGLGKSLTAIEIMERSGEDDWFYVGPRSAIASFEVELANWGAKVIPSIMTYERLQRMVENWPPGRPVPQGVIFDECQRIKTPTAGRSIAAYRLAEAMRKVWGDDCFIIGLSGAPAPKDPTDYWHQCEVICPGFLREGDTRKFEARLSLIRTVDGPTGPYPQRVTWFDDERKCKVCGLFEEDHSAADAILKGEDYHDWVASENEVRDLHDRMKGLVWVYRKKDYLSELPELRYRIIECKPTSEILNAAKLIAASSETAISGFTRLRELSDGFQYTEEEVGRQTCPKCEGKLTVEQPIPIVDEDELQTALQELYEKAAEGGIEVTDEDGLPIPEHLLLPDKYEVQTVECWKCGGEGEVPIYARGADKIACPKDKVLESLLEAHDEDGRLVVFAGFTESVDRVIETVERSKWGWISLDSRGWRSSADIPIRGSFGLLQAFQKGREKYPRICFIGQADAAGTGLTLTAACELVYFSNSFNGDARGQSEHRIHRPGMDVNKGALITDIIHLPSDLVVLENLKQKKRLQELSLGVLSEGLE